MAHTTITRNGVLTNVLGGLEPRASVYHAGGNYGRGGYWLLSSLADGVTGRLD